MTCTLCGNSNLNLLTSELRNGKGNVLHCKRCDLGILEKQISDIRAYYTNEYRKTHRNEKNETTAREIFENTRNFQGKRIDVVMRYAESPATFLDIGCSAGQFLVNLPGEFKKFGIEYDLACTKLASRMRINTDITKFPKQFDYISMFQVLEHTQEPTLSLIEIRSQLKPRGLLFVEVPNLNEALRTLWKNPGYEKFYFHEAHNWYFSEKSLRLLVEGCGYRVKAVHYIQDYSIFAHINWYFHNESQWSVKAGQGGITIKSKTEPARMINGMLEAVRDVYDKVLADRKIASNILMVLEKTGGTC